MKATNQSDTCGCLIPEGCWGSDIGDQSGVEGRHAFINHLLSRNQPQICIIVSRSPLCIKARIL